MRGEHPTHQLLASDVTGLVDACRRMLDALRREGNPLWTSEVRTLAERIVEIAAAAPIHSPSDVAVPDKYAALHNIEGQRFGRIVHNGETCDATLLISPGASDTALILASVSDLMVPLSTAAARTRFAWLEWLDMEQYGDPRRSVEWKDEESGEVWALTLAESCEPEDIEDLFGACAFARARKDRPAIVLHLEKVIDNEHVRA